MVKLTVRDKSPTEVMEIVRELRDQKLVQGLDFDFAYSHASYDPVNGHMIEPRHVVFTFYVDKYATLFALKYA